MPFKKNHEDFQEDILKEDFKPSDNYLQHKLAEKLNNISEPRIKIEEELLKKAKITDLLNVSISQNTVNPVEKLNFVDDRVNEQTGKKNNYLYFSFLFFIALLMSLSILLNTFFREKYDPFLYKIASCFKTFLFDQAHKPYTVTIGEYKDYALAKNDAIRLLPLYKYIEIKRLNTGTYTLEIKKFSSKNEAYMLANKTKSYGHESVHVRYLPD